MLIYRIDRKKRQRDTLSGIGAEIYGGRWNLPGTRAVYCAGSRSLAILEMLVHMDMKHVPNDRIMVKIEVLDEISIPYQDRELLPANWEKFPYTHASQRVFTDWIQREGTGPVLALPSAVVPEEWNFIINPLHQDMAKIKVVEVKPLVIDERLVG